MLGFTNRSVAALPHIGRKQTILQTQRITILKPRSLQFFSKFARIHPYQSSIYPTINNYTSKQATQTLQSFKIQHIYGLSQYATKPTQDKKKTRKGEGNTGNIICTVKRLTKVTQLRKVLVDNVSLSFFYG
jgi:hypothetical protein